MTNGELIIWVINNMSDPSREYDIEQTCRAYGITPPPAHAERVVALVGYLKGLPSGDPSKWTPPVTPATRPPAAPTWPENVNLGNGLRGERLGDGPVYLVYKEDDSLHGRINLETEDPAKFLPVRTEQVGLQAQPAAAPAVPQPNKPSAWDEFLEGITLGGYKSRRP